MDDSFRPNVIQHSTNPVGTAIQANADILMEIIEAERRNAVANVQNQVQRHQMMSNAFRGQPQEIHPMEQAYTPNGQQNNAEMRQRFDGPSTCQSSVGTSDQVANSSADVQAKFRLEQLQLALRPLGIFLFPDNITPLKFDPHWDTILLELGATNIAQLAERLKIKLQENKRTIMHLEQRIHVSEQERTKVANDQQMTIAALQSEILRLRAASAVASSPILSLEPSCPPHSAPPIVYSPFRSTSSEISHALLDPHAVAATSHTESAGTKHQSIPMPTSGVPQHSQHHQHHQHQPPFLDGAGHLI